MCSDLFTIIFFESKSYMEREGEGELPSTGALHRWPQCFRLVQGKINSWELHLRLSHVWHAPTLGQSWAVVSWDLGQVRPARSGTSTHAGDQHCRWWLCPLCHDVYPDGLMVVRKCYATVCRKKSSTTAFYIRNVSSILIIILSDNCVNLHCLILL